MPHLIKEEKTKHFSAVKRLWYPLDKFTMFFLIFTLLLITVTPPIINNLQTFTPTAAPLLHDFYGKQVETLKLFGQQSWGDTAENLVTNNKVFHSSGVAVDSQSTPNKVYIFDTGNNRILGYNGIGYCSAATTTACTLDSDCLAPDTCKIDGTKVADLFFGQADSRGSSCNRDNNLGFNAKPTADTTCFTGYPFTTNVAEFWMRSNMDVDSQGNLFIADYWNNRVLKYNQPFSPDKTGGKGDATADFVLGQNDMISNGRNRGGYFGSVNTPDNHSLWLNVGPPDHVAARGVSVDQSNNVWVADSFNNRVLRFPPNSANANLVLGKPNFTTPPGTTACSEPAPLNKLCTPTIARINPANGELWVADEYPYGFNARIRVFNPPFSNGMSATRTIVVKQSEKFTTWGAFDGLGTYKSQITGILFNTYKQGAYANGVAWISEHAVNRASLIDNNGNIIDMFNPLNKTTHIGNADGYGVCKDDSATGFDLVSPGGSIGVDSANNLYFADEANHRVSRYSLPRVFYTGPNSTSCQPKANGGVLAKSIPEGEPNLPTDNTFHSPVGVVAYNNQLIVNDGRKLKVWNNYLSKQDIGSNADFTIPSNASMSFISGAIDDLSRLWMYGGDGKLQAFQLPLTAASQPIATSIRLFWADAPTTEVAYDLFETGITFDSVNKTGVYISDRNKNRVLRIKNYTQPSAQMQVSMVIGQTTKTGIACNHGLATPVANGVCTPANLKFDKLGNLFVVENMYECQGNNRISIFTAGDIASAVGLFPNLSARNVINAPNLTTRGPCAFSTIDKPGSPIGLAFDSKNQLVIGNDGYYGDESVRQKKQLWLYKNPLTNPNPDTSIDIPLGASGDLSFDSSDNLFVQDHTWNKVWMINLNTDLIWMPTYVGPTAIPITTPTPTALLTPSPTQIPTPTPTTISDTTPPTISAVVQSNVQSNSATINWTTNEASSTQVEYGTTISYGSSTTLNTTMVTAHSQGLAGLSANTLYHYRVKSRDTASNLATSSDFTFTTAAASSTTSMWTSQVPSGFEYTDTRSVELGVKFRSTTAGYVKGIRFYKGAQTIGTHSGTLWSRTGTKLASANFTNETASGWQQVNFATSVAILANTTYVASYHASSGRYAFNSGYFATVAFTNGNLSALRNGTDGSNGVYRYGSAVVFPNSSFSSTNYWADVVFSTTP